MYPELDQQDVNAGAPTKDPYQCTFLHVSKADFLNKTWQM